MLLLSTLGIILTQFIIIRFAVLLSTFHRRGSRGTESGSNLPRVTALSSGLARMHIEALFLRGPSAPQHLALRFDTRKPFAGGELDVRGTPARARLTQPPVSWEVSARPSLAFGCRSWQSAQIRAGGWGRERPVLLLGRGPPETGERSPAQPERNASRSLSATPPVSFSRGASALFRFPVVPSSKRN